MNAVLATETRPRASSANPDALSSTENHFATQGASRGELKAIDSVTARLSQAGLDELRDVPLETLRSRDHLGRSVLEHLVELTARDIPSLDGASFKPSTKSLEQDRRLAIAETLVEGLSGLGRSAQGRHNTCGPETISMIVNTLAPGQWTALTRDLFEKGSHGDAIRVPDDINKQDHSPNRSMRDRVLQAAIKMACAPEPGAQYSNKHDVFFGADGANLDAGIDTAPAARVLSKLLNTEIVATTDKAAIAEICKTTKAPFYIAIEWAPDENGNHGSHALMVTGVDSEGRVHFRNPWGPSDGKVGQELKNPPRRLENPETGEESMPFEEFARRIESAAVPKETLKATYLRNPGLLAKGLLGDRSAGVPDSRAQIFRLFDPRRFGETIELESARNAASALVGKDVQLVNAARESLQEGVAVLNSANGSGVVDTFVGALLLGKHATHEDKALLMRAAAVPDMRILDVAVNALHATGKFSKQDHQKIVDAAANQTGWYKIRSLERLLADPHFGLQACLRGLTHDSKDVREISAKILSVNPDRLMRSFGQAALEFRPTGFLESFELGDNCRAVDRKPNWFQRNVVAWWREGSAWGWN